MNRKNSPKKQIISAILLLSILLLSGCASVRFYSDAELKNKTGLRYYTLKPYLLVEYKAEKENTVKASVVYLPDLANPQYVVIRNGLGSGELKMTFGNGALTSYGVVSESELPKALEAFASVLSKSAYAAQAFTGAGLPEPDLSGTYFRLYEIIPDSGGTTLKEVVPVK